MANRDEPSPNNECNKYYQGEEWKCYFLEYSYPFIRGKFLILNSEYDSFEVPNFLQLNCLKDGKSGETLSSCNKTAMEFI